MKKTVLMLIGAAVLGISCTQEPVLSPQQQTLQAKLVGSVTGERREGSILIKLTPDAQKNIVDGSLDPETFVKSLEDGQIEPLFPLSTRTSETAVRHGLDRWYSILFDESVSPSAVAEELASNNAIQAIEYNTLIESTHSGTSVEHISSVATKAATGTASFPFNDPEAGVQWNLINTGDKTISETALEGADVGVKDAWKLTAGDPRIIVAVFDQGVYTLHPDLKDNLWVNTAEYDGQDGVDDDANGYKDDKHGYNFAEKKGRLTAISRTGDHGTHIAGTIAATNNNGIGVSSIAGGTGIGDGVRIMSCQIFFTNGSKTDPGTVAKAFHYAADHGACIAQCSYGEEFASDTEYRKEHSVEHDALKYFLDPANANCEALDANIAVFAAGNFNKPASLYPGALKECISVTAVGPDFLPGGYSHYGAGCDIAAPGGDIMEGNAEAPRMILSTGLVGDGILSSPGYIYKYGTSMACPHVSGVAALGMSYALKIGKKFSREDFISRLLTSTNDINALMTGSTMKLFVENGKYVEVDIFPKKGRMGTGAVDAWKFLMELEGTPSYLTSPGKKLSINVTDCLGDTAENLEYTLEIAQETLESLGIAEIPALTDGILEMTCTKIGSGKIRFKASVGGEGEISALDFSKEISIVSRPSVAKNGGWL